MPIAAGQARREKSQQRVRNAKAQLRSASELATQNCEFLHAGATPGASDREPLPIRRCGGGAALRAQARLAAGIASTKSTWRVLFNYSTTPGRLHRLLFSALLRRSVKLTHTWLKQHLSITHDVLQRRTANRVPSDSLRIAPSLMRALLPTLGSDFGSLLSSGYAMPSASLLICFSCPMFR